MITPMTKEDLKRYQIEYMLENNNTGAAMTTQYLAISQEDYQKGYNYNYVSHVSQDYAGNDYLPWYKITVIVKELFPNLALAECPLIKHLDAEGNIAVLTLNITLIDTATGIKSTPYPYPVMNKDTRHSSATKIDAR